MNYNTLFSILFSFTLLSGCRTSYLSHSDKKNIRIDHIQENEEIQNFINPYTQELKHKTERVLAFTPEDLTKQNKNLFYVFADITYEETAFLFKKQYKKAIDFALINRGGLRTIIPQGSITVGKIYEVMPFDNKIVIVGLQGEKMQQLLSYLANKPQPISHLKITHKEKQLINATINNKSFDMNKTYYIATTDYLQGGGDHMSFLKNPKELYTLDVLARDMYLNYFEKIDTLSIDKTIRYQ
ncbi:MAG: 5'-nucleotidase C-terminal domain-containing protein [Flavobacteriales bacterium]